MLLKSWPTRWPRALLEIDLLLHVAGVAPRRPRRPVARTRQGALRPSRRRFERARSRRLPVLSGGGPEERSPCSDGKIAERNGDYRPRLAPTRMSRRPMKTLRLAPSGVRRRTISPRSTSWGSLVRAQYRPFQSPVSGAFPFPISCVLFGTSGRYVCVRKRRSKMLHHRARCLADVAPLERLDYREMAL
jgi:hypothetical protein